MDLLELIGPGICHQDPARSPEATWLCHRCNGLYLGGLLGLVHAPAAARRLGLGAQLLLCAVLVLPIAVDGVILGRGSPLDLPWFRILTGLLAGIGSGLFFGTRSHDLVRWPPVLRRLRWPWAAAWIWVAMGLVGYAAGVPSVLDSAVAAGLLGLCALGTAAAWSIAIGIRRRLRRGLPPAGRPRVDAGWFLTAAVLELLLVARIPNAWKPTTSWIRTAVDWIRSGGGT